MPEKKLQADFSLRRNAFQLHISTSVTPEFTALFGPSGCGKTMTLKCLSGILKPNSGFIRFADQILFSRETGIFIKPENREIGHVFQDSRLFPHLNIEENLRFGINSRRPERQRFDFAQVVQILGLERFLKRRPDSLSGGESQRVAIGRALLASPRLLLMDEPLAALDLPAKISILNILRQIHQEFSLPIIYVSHDIATVLNFATDVLLMQAGKIIAAGKPFEVLSGFFSSSLYAGDVLQNIVQVRLVSGDRAAGLCLVATKNVELVLPFFEGSPGEIFYLDIPASEIILAMQKPQGLSARNILPGRVSKIQHIGERVFIEVNAGFDLRVEVMEKTLEMMNLQPASRVFLIIKATAFRKVT